MARLQDEEEITSSQDDVAAAWDAVEEKSSEDPEHEGAVEIEEEDVPRETLEDASEVAPQETPEEEAPAVEEAPAEEPPPIAAEADDIDTPLQSLSASAREVWKDTPKEIREEILRREQGTVQALQKNADHAKRAQQMDAVLTPFSQYLNMTGQPPAQTIGGLLQTASMLQMGSPTQKAQVVAQLINQFGVDINALDQTLVGETPQEAAPDIGQLVEQKVNERMQQQNMQQQSHVINNELATFQSDPKNEFYNDVRGDMADILEIKGNQGISLTLPQAYELACQMNPSVRSTLAMRANQESLAQRKPAAVSISGNPGGPGAVEEHNSLNAALNAAWDEVARR